MFKVGIYRTFRIFQNKSLSAEAVINSSNNDSDTFNEMPGQWWHKNDKTFKPVLRGHWQKKHSLEFHILIVQ